jgi:YggT family protein
LNIFGRFLELYFYILFASVLLSWIPTAPGGFLGQVKLVLRTLTEPVLAPVRRVIKPVRFGGGAIDLSALVVLLAIQILIPIVGS